MKEDLFFCSVVFVLTITVGLIINDLDKMVKSSQSAVTGLGHIDLELQIIQSEIVFTRVEILKEIRGRPLK